MTPRLLSYPEFWPFYLREHAAPLTRRLHALGTGLGLFLLAAGVVFGLWWLILLGLFAGYSFAWASHLLIERNRPASFRYPFWSLISDFRMAWLMVSGRLDAELQRAGVTHSH